MMSLRLALVCSFAGFVSAADVSAGSPGARDADTPLENLTEAAGDDDT